MPIKARIAIFFSVLIAILLLGPFFMGILFQQIYQQILDVYSTTHQLSIQIEQYKRGWFNSSARIRIEILDQSISEFFNFSHTDDNVKLPPIIVDQRIHHGPLLYKDFYGFSTLFGLAAIHNKVLFSPDIERMVQAVESFDYVSFMGNYYKHFRLTDLTMMYPESDTDIKVGLLEGDVWIMPRQKKVKTNFNLNHLLFFNPDALLIIPNLNAHFEMDKKFWRGHDQLNISSIALIENGNETVGISGIKLDWMSVVNNDVVDVSKEFDIDQMHILGYSLGPLHFVLNAYGLNISALEEMIDAYQVIRERGELYQFQLLQKMVMMLPKVFTKGMSINLDTFDLKTQDGHLLMKGKMVWDMEKEMIPDQLPDIISAAMIQLDLNVSKSLVKQWIMVASTLPWFNPSNPDIEQSYHLAQQSMIFTKEYNEIGIHSLVDQGLLSEPEGVVLISMQRMNESSTDYYLALKKLLLEKQISLTTNHYLLYLYMQSQSPINNTKILLQDNQRKISEEMMSQINAWISEGYIEDKDDNYLLLFQQKNHQYWFNGILFPT